MTDVVTDEFVIELSDTDMARFAFFGAVVSRFEMGLRGVMEEIDLTFRDLFDRGLGIPIVNVSCDYRNPMMYADRITLLTEVAEVSERTVTLSLTLQKEDGSTAANGSLTFCFYDIDERQGTPVPEDVRADLQALAT